MTNEWLPLLASTETFIDTGSNAAVEKELEPKVKPIILSKRLSNVKCTIPNYTSFMGCVDKQVLLIHMYVRYDMIVPYNTDEVQTAVTAKSRKQQSTPRPTFCPGRTYPRSWGHSSR